MGDKEPRGDKKPRVPNSPFSDIPHATKKVIAAAQKILSEPDSIIIQTGGISRRRIYELYLSPEARLGKDVVGEDGKTRHIKGIYERFPDLKKKEINGILNLAIIVLAEASVPQYVGSIVEGTLLRARVKAKDHKKK